MNFPSKTVTGNTGCSVLNPTRQPSPRETELEHGHTTGSNTYVQRSRHTQSACHLSRSEIWGRSYHQAWDRPQVSSPRHTGEGIASLDPSRAEPGSYDLPSKFTTTSFQGPPFGCPIISYFFLPIRRKCTYVYMSKGNPWSLKSTALDLAFRRHGITPSTSAILWSSPTTPILNTDSHQMGTMTPLPPCFPNPLKNEN